MQVIPKSHKNTVLLCVQEVHEHAAFVNTNTKKPSHRGLKEAANQQRRTRATAPRNLPDQLKLPTRLLHLSQCSLPSYTLAPTISLAIHLIGWTKYDVHSVSDCSGKGGILHLSCGQP